MTGRWSNARQGVIDAARALIISDGCTYALPELEGAVKATAVENLLEGEVFHFGDSVSYFLTQTYYMLPCY